MKSATVVSLLLLAYLGHAMAQTAKAPVEVPFEFVNNQIVLQVKIGGKGPFNVLLDTDTDPSAIDTVTARELGLQVGSRGAPASGGGTETNTVFPTKLPTVEIGSLTARDVIAATVDLTKVANRIGNRIVQIDYPNSKLRFYAESPHPRILSAPNTVNTIALPFRRDDGVVMIDSVFINGEKMKATLDTGSSGTFILTPAAVEILGLEEQARDGQTEKSVGYNGEYERKVGILKSVRLGRLAIDSAPATFWLPGTGHDKKTFQVNIGNGFFQDFVMTFDFRNKIVVFEKMD